MALSTPHGQGQGSRPDSSSDSPGAESELNWPGYYIFDTNIRYFLKNKNKGRAQSWVLFELSDTSNSSILNRFFFFLGVRNVYLCRCLKYGRTRPLYVAVSVKIKSRLCKGRRESWDSEWRGGL